nr:AI-2E family transporter [Propionibacterium sp.]
MTSPDAVSPVSPGADGPGPGAPGGPGGEPAPASPRPRLPIPSLLERAPFQTGFLGVLGGLAAIGLVGVLQSLQTILVIVILSLFIALGINPVVEWLVRRGVRRALAVGLVTLVVLVVLSLGVGAVVPMVNEQGLRLFRNAPGYLQALRENDQIAALDAQFDIIGRVTEFVTSGTWVNALFGGLLGAGLVVASTVFSAVMTLVLTLYFLSALPAIKNLIYQLAPASRRPRVRYLANEMFERIGGYLTGMFLVVALWAGGSFVVMNAVGLGGFALALCIVVGALAFVPVVGWMFAAALVATIAFSVSPNAGLITLGYFVVYSQLDAYLVQPRIFSSSLNVPPALIVLGALSGGILLGIVGALLAIPTVASLILLYREVLVPHLDER